ncbi:hypothetical protein MYX04_15405, partial [Nitrospiraceae bacterium AH_259_D15_M11_P09]|nr:hypothetical protein [Nitrospiraceae bacterium AH_259_D15_M11_P09]
MGERFQERLRQLLRSLRILRSWPGALVAVLILTVANWLASILQTKLLFDGVGAGVPLDFTAAA